jgi:hypothetical protein
MAIMRSKRKVVQIINRKKDVYYPLITLAITFFIYWSLIIFINITDSQVVLPFFIWSVIILFFRYSFDLYYEKKDEIESNSNRVFIFLLLLAIVSTSVIVLRLVALVLFNKYYFIPILIDLLLSILIYYVLHIEIKKYYSTKRKQIIE